MSTKSFEYRSPLSPEEIKKKMLFDLKRDLNTGRAFNAADLWRVSPHSRWYSVIIFDRETTGKKKLLKKEANKPEIKKFEISTIPKSKFTSSIHFKGTIEALEHGSLIKGEVETDRELSIGASSSLALLFLLCLFPGKTPIWLAIITILTTCFFGAKWRMEWSETSLFEHYMPEIAKSDQLTAGDPEQEVVFRSRTP